MNGTDNNDSRCQTQNAIQPYFFCFGAREINNAIFNKAEA